MDITALYYSAMAKAVFEVLLALSVLSAATILLLLIVAWWHEGPERDGTDDRRFGLAARLVRLASDSFVLKRYIHAGLRFGYAESFVPCMGEGIGFDRLLDSWTFWEREYVRRGYRAVHWKMFEMAAAFNADIELFYGVRMEPDEEPRCWADTYRRHREEASRPKLDALGRASDEAAKNDGTSTAAMPHGQMTVTVGVTRMSPGVSRDQKSPSSDGTDDAEG